MTHQRWLGEYFVLCPHRLTKSCLPLVPLSTSFVQYFFPHHFQVLPLLSIHLSHSLLYLNSFGIPFLLFHRFYLSVWSVTTTSPFHPPCLKQPPQPCFSVLSSILYLYVLPFFLLFQFPNLYIPSIAEDSFGFHGAAAESWPSCVHKIFLLPV